MNGPTNPMHIGEHIWIVTEPVLNATQASGRVWSSTIMRWAEPDEVVWYVKYSVWSVKYSHRLVFAPNAPSLNPLPISIAPQVCNCRWRVQLLIESSIEL